MKTLQQMFLGIDMYGQRPEFLIGGSKYYKTYVGSVLTLISVLLMAAAGIYFSLALFDTKTPTVVFSTTNPKGPPSQNITQNNFAFAIGIQNPFTYNQFIDESIYMVKASYQIGKRVSVSDSSEFDWSIQDLELERCQINSFSNKFEDIFSSLPLNDMYCIKQNNFSLFGTFLDKEYSFIRIQVFECSNSTSVIPCKPKTEINQILAGAFFSLTYTDITIDPSNMNNPDQLQKGDGYTTISNLFFKEIHMYLKKVSIVSDTGVIFTDQEKKGHLQLDLLKEMTDFRKAENFVDITIKLSTKIDTYDRSYEKLQNIAAQIGGIIEIIKFVGSYMCHSFANTMMDLSIVNKLFNVIYKEEEKDKKDNNIQLNRQAKNYLNYSSNFNNFNANDKSPHSITMNKIGIADSNQMVLNEHQKNLNIPLENNFINSNHVINDLSRKSDINYNWKKEGKKTSVNNLNSLNNPVQFDKIRLGFCKAFFLYLFPCLYNKKKEILILKKGKKKFQKKLDIVYLIQELDNLQRLKHLILDTDQLNLFNLPYRPVLKLENTVNSYLLRTKKSSIYTGFIDDLNNAVNKDVAKHSYNKIKSRMIEGSMDNKIYDLLEDNVKNILSSNMNRGFSMMQQ